MATLIHLAERGSLSRLEAALSWREQEERRIYVSPKGQRWMEETLPEELSEWNLEISPLEQLDQFLKLYCSGKELTYERQFRPVRHVGSGVWELKTADVRLFGWFPVKDCFICSNGDMKWRIKQHGLVPGYRDEAMRFRDQLDLDDPKFVPGDNPDDVISAFCFPPPKGGG